MKFDGTDTLKDLLFYLANEEVGERRNWILNDEFLYREYGDYLIREYGRSSEVGEAVLEGEEPFTYEDTTAFIKELWENFVGGEA